MVSKTAENLHGRTLAVWECRGSLVFYSQFAPLFSSHDGDLLGGRDGVE